MMRGTSERTTTQPAPSPVNLEPKLDIMTVCVHMGGALGCAVIFWLAWWGAASSIDTYQMSGLRWGSFFVTLSLIIGTTWGGWKLWGSFLNEIGDVRARRKDWHKQLLWERRQQGGVIVEQERTEWSLKVNDVGDVLLLALYLYQQVQLGKDRPWSNDNLAGDLYLSDGMGRQRLIGTMTDYEARKAGNLMADLGLVQNRGGRGAGKWIAQDADAVLEAVVKGMPRIGKVNQSFIIDQEEE